MTREYLSSALLGVFKRVQQTFSILFGPPTLRPVPLVSLGSPTHAAIVTMEWHTLLLQSGIFQVLGGFSAMLTLVAWAFSRVFLK